jgi:hypothetical protein
MPAILCVYCLPNTRASDRVTAEINPREALMMSNATESTERPRIQYHQPRTPYREAHSNRQPFHHPRTSLGTAGHWIHLLSVAAPLVIGEVIKDSDKRWRALRGVSVGAALLSEGVWTYRLAQERKKDEEAHAALKECSERCR